MWNLDFFFTEFGTGTVINEKFRNPHFNSISPEMYGVILASTLHTSHVMHYEEVTIKVTSLGSNLLALN